MASKLPPSVSSDMQLHINATANAVARLGAKRPLLTEASHRPTTKVVEAKVIDSKPKETVPKKKTLADLLESQKKPVVDSTRQYIPTTHNFSMAALAAGAMRIYKKSH